MYQYGDLVLYGIHGVCRILDFEIKIVNRKKTEYYVLAPILNEQARFYVPTQNEAAVSKLHTILTRDEWMTLLSVENPNMNGWISDEGKRKAYYKEIINSGDRKELLCMISLLHRHRTEQIAQGRKFHLSDENFLRDAEKVIGSEISLVFDMPMEDAVKRIRETLK